MEWNELTGPGSKVFRVQTDYPHKKQNCQVIRFISAKTRRHVWVLMLDADVLTRDEVAKYHGRATSRNRFYRTRRYCGSRVSRSGLTEGGRTFYSRKVAVVVRRIALRRC